MYPTNICANCKRTVARDACMTNPRTSLTICTRCLDDRLDDDPFVFDVTGGYRHNIRPGSYALGGLYERALTADYRPVGASDVGLQSSQLVDVTAQVIPTHEDYAAEARRLRDEVTMSLKMAGLPIPADLLDGEEACEVCGGTGESGSPTCPQCPGCLGDGAVELSAAERHKRATERARQEPLEGPLNAQETLDEARALVELTKCDLARLTRSWDAWNRCQVAARWRKWKVGVGIPATVILGVVLAVFTTAVFSGPVAEYGDYLSALAALCVSLGGAVSSLIVAMKAKQKAPARKQEKPEKSLDEAKADYLACLEYLWVTEDSLPESMILPAMPDWTAIENAVEYDPEADGYPRYSFDIPAIDYAPTYESTVTEVRARLRH